MAKIKTKFNRGPFDCGNVEVSVRKNGSIFQTIYLHTDGMKVPMIIYKLEDYVKSYKPKYLHKYKFNPKNEQYDYEKCIECKFTKAK